MADLERTFKNNVVFKVYIKSKGNWGKKHVGTFNSLNEADIELGKWFGLNYESKPCSLSFYEEKGDSLNTRKIKVKDNIISFEVEYTRSAFKGSSDDVGTYSKDHDKIWIIAEFS